MNKTDCTSPPRTGLEFERRSEGGIQKLVGEGMKFTRKKKAIFQLIGFISGRPYSFVRSLP